MKIHPHKHRITHTHEQTHTNSVHKLFGQTVRKKNDAQDAFGDLSNQQNYEKFLNDNKETYEKQAEVGLLI